MSLLAKALLGFASKMTMHSNGFVHVPEEWWAKWLELARREEKKPTCTAHGITECLVCRREGSR